MTDEYKKRIDSLLLDFLSHVHLRDEDSGVMEEDLRRVIQKEFFFRLVVSLPEEANASIKRCIQENSLNDTQTHDEIARACLSAYSREYMRTILDHSITHIITTYINITMSALTKEQKRELEDFQRNLLLSAE